MKPNLIPLLAVALSAATFAQAADAPPEDPLKPLDGFIGGTWVAEVKTPAGGPLRVETTFARASHGKFVRFAVVFKSDGKTTPAYEGLYWWDPAKRSVVMLQIDSRGTPTESVVRFTAEVMEQDNTVTRPDGSQTKQRVKVVREGNDAFRFTAHVPDGEKWVEAVTIRYTRDTAGR